MSPVALHVAAGLHAPPWQFVEQQSAGCAHASPSVLQVAPVGPGGSASQTLPKPQRPEQHCESSAQLCDALRHTAGLQVAPGVPAFGQFCEQQSESVAHCSPGYPHTPPELLQCPVASHAKQHCEAEVHATPVPPHVMVPEPGSAHFEVVGSQTVLLQQYFVSVQVSPRFRHTPSGGRQTCEPKGPPHEPVLQQSVGSSHASPT
jgi:hypothetical protein